MGVKKSCFASILRIRLSLRVFQSLGEELMRDGWVTVQQTTLYVFLLWGIIEVERSLRATVGWSAVKNSLAA